MRIGIVSDIHGHHEELGRALAALSDVDAVWCAGDIVTQYRFCATTTRMLRDAGVVSIRGNHDAHVRAEGDDDVAWLASLPFEHRAEFDGCRVLMTHGSPWEPRGDYLSAHNPRWRDADDLGVDVVIVGHTHEPMVATFGATLVLNPGSLGEPRQRDDRRGTYAVLDTNTRTADLRFL